MGLFHGTGHYAGKMLVVNLGRQAPGDLYGSATVARSTANAADGSATETLLPVGTACAERRDP